MLRSAAEGIETRLEAVDSCGIVPVARPGRAFATAHAFRRWLQKNLLAPLREFPEAEPLGSSTLRACDADLREIEAGWPPLPDEFDLDALLAALPIDHSVGRVSDRTGGTRAARDELRRFLDQGLPRYTEDRNQPQRRVTSRLSAYLHHGQISSHEIFAALAEGEGWSFSRVAGDAKGARAGWWGMSENAEAFVDQLITWRELGFNAAFFLENYQDYESLPAWARTTLAEHEEDPRPHLYDLPEFETARTHDALWNAAQTQLVRKGEMHNYLRMLWGKKILEWSASPRRALEIMIELNNRYALDGRDPNSYSGIFWVLGRYDRAWGPERAVFGKIRYMSSQNTARKLRVKEYVERYGNEALV
jgi:deoxyribodipyrimidine photo-lyase